MAFLNKLLTALLHRLPTQFPTRFPTHFPIYLKLVVTMLIWGGTFITGRATRNMDRLPIRLEGKNVLVDADHVFESDKDGAAWAKATIKLA